MTNILMLMNIFESVIKLQWNT